MALRQAALRSDGVAGRGGAIQGCQRLTTNHTICVDRFRLAPCSVVRATAVIAAVAFFGHVEPIQYNGSYRVVGYVRSTT